MFGKTRMNFILLLTVVNLVFSCLVTNCPRGGKRGKLNFNYPPNNVLSPRLKKCKLCSLGKEICLGIHCSLKCKDEDHCVAQEVCCFKGFRDLQKSCEFHFHRHSPPTKKLKPSSAFLNKIFI